MMPPLEDWFLHPEAEQYEPQPDPPLWAGAALLVTAGLIIGFALGRFG